MSTGTKKTLAVLVFLAFGVGVLLLRNAGTVSDTASTFMTVGLMAAAVASYFVIESRAKKRAGLERKQT